MAYTYNPIRTTSDVDGDKVAEFLGIRKTLEEYGEILLKVFSVEELHKAYGPVFEVWFSNRKEI